jgi:ornithine decarboxylase
MTTARILDFIRTRRPDGPCLVVDLDVVRDNFQSFSKALPDSSIYYAVKANPAPEILRLLAGLGSNFDCASVTEIEMALKAGATAARISYGNTIKKERDIARAHALGVSLFAVDSHEEVEKIARAAPGARVFCRVLTDGDGAEWPLSRKFGCAPQMAADLLVRARDLGLVPYGVSFHVGSQQTDVDQWDVAVGETAMLFSALNEAGIELKLVNLGGGFPARYTEEVDAIDSYAGAIMQAMTKHFGNRLPSMIVEPGRYMVGDAGVIEAEVVLVSRKAYDDERRWVYLDIGRFGGLAETEGEAIRYPIRTGRDGEADGPVVLAGPTCDSADILYDKANYRLPLDLKVGERVRLHATGAYTTTYSAVAFNGFEPLQAYYI